MIFRHTLFWLPNLITLARILAVPVFVYLLINEYWAAAFWVFMAAGVSDAIDGFVAKNWGLETTVGKYLDPIADKALLVCAYITLGHLELIPLWLVILVVFRDLLIVGGAMLYQHLTGSLTMRPLFISKVNTATQLLLVLAVLWKMGLGLWFGEWLVTLLVWIVAVTTFISGAAYVLTWGRSAVSLEEER